MTQFASQILTHNPFFQSAVASGTAGGGVGVAPFGGVGSAALIFGGVQAALATIQALGANKQIVTNADSELDHAKEIIGDRFKALFREQSSQSKKGLAGLGAVTNAISRNVRSRKSATEGFEGSGDTTALGNSGISVDELYRMIGFDIEATAVDIKQAAMNDIDQLRLQKEEIKDQAKAAQTVPILAGLGGAAQGVAQGTALDGALDRNKAARVQLSQAKEMRMFNRLASINRVSAAQAGLGFLQQSLGLSQIEATDQQSLIDRWNMVYGGGN